VYPTAKERLVKQHITPCLWFDTQAQQAAEYYVSVFPDSRIVSVTHYPESVAEKAGSVLLVEFELGGEPFTALNGGPQFTFDEAVSFYIVCEDQAELDYFWDKLTDGGEEGPCGWAKDRFGLSWQVVPDGMTELFRDDDPERASRAMTEMMTQHKLDLAAVRAAADGAPA
jgi:predicted 3-demethylubiquinone-9 3-methyltransferase (glyoxalase superfamily)